MKLHKKKCLKYSLSPEEKSQISNLLWSEDEESRELAVTLIQTSRVFRHYRQMIDKKFSIDRLNGKYLKEWNTGCWKRRWSEILSFISK